MKFYTRYNNSISKGLTCSKDSPVQQHFKESTDINNIVDNYTRTGMLNGSQNPVYDDFSDSFDFLEAQNKVIAARNAFSSLDSKLRSRFSNNPAKLLDFLADSNNKDEAIKLGLISEPEPLPEPPIEPPKAPPKA